ncbi:MAG: 30S ribosomal protein S18 [Planctomycetes bacterium]|nr:30S ribosomal protein S18 [Planctomycetota bacterium]
MGERQAVRSRTTRKTRPHRSCRFCRDRVEEISYKDVEKLKHLMSGEGAIFSKKRSGNCSRHQRMVKRAIKQARFMALLPYN